MNELEKAKKILNSGGYTCVLCRGEALHTSHERGVKPLVSFIESGTDFHGFCAADKVIGKATAFLYILLGVKAVFAAVISKPALAALEKHGIHTEYETLTENIINRQKNGICPFEEAVLEITDENDAYKVIINKMKRMNIY